jgi:hypothetical protein
MLRYLTLSIALLATACGSSSSPAAAQLAPDAGGGDDSGSSGDDAGDDASTPTATFTASGSMPGNIGRFGMPMVYAASQKRFVGFGGETSQPVAETWAFTPADGMWTKIADTNAPPGRFCHCSAYLPDQNQLLLVGGRDDNGPLAPAAWTLDLVTNAWTAVAGAVPKGTIGCQTAYMDNLKKAVVFGGYSDQLYADTWTYDPVARAFTKLTPATSPPGRGDGMAVYDPGDGGRVLMFGGTQNIDLELDDLWSFDGTTWTKITPAGAAPSKRRVVSFAFDTQRRTLFVYGGTVDTKDLMDVWTLDAATLTWTMLLDRAPARARGFTSTGYDPVSDTYFVFGGLQQPLNNLLKDGWQVKLAR